MRLNNYQKIPTGHCVEASQNHAHSALTRKQWADKWLGSKRTVKRGELLEPMNRRGRLSPNNLSCECIVSNWHRGKIDAVAHTTAGVDEAYLLQRFVQPPLPTKDSTKNTRTATNIHRQHLKGVDASRHSFICQWRLSWIWWWQVCRLGIRCLARTLRGRMNVWVAGYGIHPWMQGQAVGKIYVGGSVDWYVRDKWINAD